MRLNRPIIIAGMHRSGTSMITRMLEEAGLFVGIKKDQNDESLFFQNINNYIMHFAGCSWDNPLKLNGLLENDSNKRYILNRLCAVLNSPSAIQYMGLNKYFRYRLLEHLNVLWGWKDPRNTFTLPLWLELFPEAKVIFVSRHGVDVAESLRRRELDRNVDKKKILARVKSYYSPIPILKEGLYTSARCRELKGAFDLWMEYMVQSKCHMAKYSQNFISVKYESLLNDPDLLLEEIFDFIGLDFSKKKIKHISKKFCSDRVYAYRKNPELQSFAVTVADKLTSFGYEA